MRIYENGVYRDMTSEELAAMQAHAFESVSAEISDEEKLSLLLASIPVEKPSDGNELPFKLGYKWVPIYDGNKFAWQLVSDPDAIGTADNPIYWVGDGSVPMLDNAYYMIDGVRHVCMGGQFIEF